MAGWNYGERDAFVKRMQKRGATLSHHNGSMQAIGKRVGAEYRHLIFSDRPEDSGRVWLSITHGDSLATSRTEVHWVDGNIEDWFRVFDEDVP